MKLLVAMKSFMPRIASLAAGVMSHANARKTPMAESTSYAIAGVTLTTAIASATRHAVSLSLSVAKLMTRGIGLRSARGRHPTRVMSLTVASRSLAIAVKKLMTASASFTTAFVNEAIVGVRSLPETGKLTTAGKSYAIGSTKLTTAMASEMPRGDNDTVPIAKLSGSCARRIDSCMYPAHAHARLVKAAVGSAVPSRERRP